MRRYLRVYAAFVRFAFSRAMEFRFDFFFRIVMDIVWNFVQFGFFQVLFLHSDLFGGWTRPQVHAFLGALFLADALQMTVFANNMWWLPVRVNRGDLDYHLTRPVAPLFMLSVSDFAAGSCANLLVAAGFTAWALGTYPGSLGAANVACFFGLISVGVFALYLLELGLTIPVFWMESGAGLRDLHHVMVRYSQYPDAIYPGWMRRVLTRVLPLAFLASYPTRALFATDPWPLVVEVLAVTAALTGVVLAAWRFGLANYSSASS